MPVYVHREPAPIVGITAVSGCGRTQTLSASIDKFGTIELEATGTFYPKSIRELADALIELADKAEGLD